MNTKKFVYQERNLPLLKTDFIARLIFCILFLCILAWQAYNTVTLYLHKNLTTLLLIVGSIIMFVSLFMFLLSLAYLIKDKRIIYIVKRNGQYIADIQLIFNTKRSGFLNMYYVINEVLSVVCLLIFVAGITYTFLDKDFYNRIYNYLPAVTLFLVVCYNSIAHLKNELKTINILEEYIIYR